MAKDYLTHCSYCGYNFETETARADQKCPECSHRASHSDPIDESKHTAGIKTNYKGQPMDETENKVP